MNSSGSIALEALTLARTGDIRGALALLRAARDNGPLDEAATSLMFNLLHDAGDDESLSERIALCAHGLTLAQRPVTRSSWHLRRGTLHLAARRRGEALADLQAVLKLNASEDHTTEARKGLLAVAQLPAEAKPRRGP